MQDGSARQVEDERLRLASSGPQCAPDGLQVAATHTEGPREENSADFWTVPSLLKYAAADKHERLTPCEALTGFPALRPGRVAKDEGARDRRGSKARTHVGGMLGVAAKYHPGQTGRVGAVGIHRVERECSLNGSGRREDDGRHEMALWS